MLMAASVMNSGRDRWHIHGEKWLIRRSVRSPVRGYDRSHQLVGVQAAFMSASASPSGTTHGFCAASWLWSASTNR